ncbi:hypothetical protein HDV01_005467 [Terramyces sp. JEL0728]|nr:hypothetical protein HDV01_005467 [Terramyces sp. JEL0728]
MTAGDHHENKKLADYQTSDTILPAFLIGIPAGTVAGLVHGAWFQHSRVTTTQLIFRNSFIYASLGGLYQGTTVAASAIRGRQDNVNYAISGGVAGFVLGMTRNRIGHGVLQAGLLAVLSFAAATLIDEHTTRFSKPYDERRGFDGFFAVKKPDPFANRIKEIQAKE